MVDFFELERRCKKIKRKKITIYLSIFIILLIGISTFIYFNLNQQQNKTHKHITIKKNEKKEIKKIEPVKVKKELNKTTKEITQKVVKQKEQKQKEKEKNISMIHNEVGKIDTKPKIIEEKNNKKEKEEFIIEEPKLELNIEFENIETINGNKKIETSQNIDKNSKEIKSKTDNREKKKIVKSEEITFLKALSLAKTYYETGDFINSMKWCKIASKIDNNDERIWKLYALNFEKTGQKDKAIKILKTYLKYKDSMSLKYLLERLEE